MTIDDIIKQAKSLISDKNISEAKSFIEKHKDDLGEHYETLMKLISANADGAMDKVKDLFSKK